MTVKDIILQIENLYGKSSEKYMMLLINDGLIDMSAKVQHFTKNAKSDLTQNKRHYKFNTSGSDFGTTDVLDIIRVEVLDTDSRYNVIPRLSNPNRLLKSDTDDSGTGDST